MRSEEGTPEAEWRQSAGQRADTQATGPPTWTSTSDTTAGGTASTSEMPYDCLSNILEHITDAYDILLCAHGCLVSSETPPRPTTYGA